MGERFAGRYELLDPLGEGGMASVWRVWDEREGRVVAAKVLRQSDAVSLLRFLREQAVRVAGEHVLTPLGWAGEDDRVLFTMPVVDGGSVQTLVGDFGPLPPRLVEELLGQLLDALDVAHGARIVHRDVKPANLLLVATGRERPHLLLSDFGIAVDLDGPRLTQSGAVVGTPGFVAPEVLAGGEPTTAADLYAAGRVGLFMLTGAASGSATDAGPGRVDAPERLVGILTALTAADPAQRPETAAAAHAALDRSDTWDPGVLGEVELFAHVGPDPLGRPQLLAGRSTAPGRPAPAPEPASDAATPVTGVVPARRRPGPLVVAALVLAVLGIGALLLAWSPWSASSAVGPPPADGSRSAGPTPTGPATTGSTGTPGSTDTSGPATSSGPSPSGTATPSSGSVTVGTVVTTVGQPCDAGAVGSPERTTAGAAVVCQRRADGSYAWDPPPG